MLTRRQQRSLTDDTRLFPSSEVLACEQGDVTILMCLRTSRFHTLDEIGSLVWQALNEGRTVAEAIACVARACKVSTPDIANDIKAFLAELAAMGLVSSRRSSGFVRESRHPIDTLGPPIAVRCPSTPVLIWCLVFSALLLRFFGLRRTLNWAYRVSGPIDSQPDGSEKIVAQRLSTASSWSPLRTECLEQSVALLWILRRQGVAAHLRIGVQPFPFFAHAWVEHRGAPINDSVEKLKLYRPFPILEPTEAA